MIRDDKARFNFINENIELFRKPDRKTKKSYRRLRALARLFWNKEVGARGELISEVESDINSLKGFDFKKMVFSELKKGNFEFIIEKAKKLKEYNLDLASRVYFTLIKDLEEDEIYLIAEPDLEFLMQKVQKDALIDLLAELQKKYEATLNKDEVRLTEIFKRAEIKINTVIEVEGLKVDDFLEDCMEEIETIKTDVRAEESKGSGEVADRIDAFFETLK
jgi:hypothetical protein